MRRALLIGFLLLAGCEGLVARSKQMRYDLLQDGQPATPGAELVLAAQSVAVFEVDLSALEEWEDHHEDFDALLSSGLEGNVLTDATLYLSVYAGDSADLTDPASEGLLILERIRVSRSSRQLDLSRTREHSRNEEALLELVRAGRFHLYLLNEGDGELRADELQYLVTATVGL